MDEENMGADKAWFDNFNRNHAEAFRAALLRALNRVEASGVNLADVFKPAGMD